MDSRKEIAIKKWKSGYTCSQAIACTYHDLVGMDEETLFAATEALGAGMGKTEGTCGAVSAACVLAGCLNSSKNLEKPDSKVDTYKLSGEILDRFIAKNTTVRCKELKGIETGKALCSCKGCIEYAAELVEEVLFSDK